MKHVCVELCYFWLSGVCCISHYFTLCLLCSAFHWFISYFSVFFLTNCYITPVEKVPAHMVDTDQTPRYGVYLPGFCQSTPGRIFTFLKTKMTLMHAQHVTRKYIAKRNQKWCSRTGGVVLFFPHIQNLALYPQCNVISDSLARYLGVFWLTNVAASLQQRWGLQRFAYLTSF